jgi:hypothetical protein
MDITAWINKNSGVVSVLIFLSSLMIAWFSGIFKALRNKPQFKIEALLGPTICSTFLTGKKFNGYDVHQTGISLYLKISNIGSAPSSINKIKAGFHWHLQGFNFLWLKYRIGWYWLDPIISLNDFTVDIGENVKVYPFLIQKSYLSNNTNDHYLQVGKSAIGVVYFEHGESWGGCFPTPRKDFTKIKVKVLDSFGGRHTKVLKVPIVSLEEAKKYSEAFGETFRELHKNKNQT